MSKDAKATGQCLARSEEQVHGLCANWSILQDIGGGVGAVCLDNEPAARALIEPEIVGEGNGLLHNVAAHCDGCRWVIGEELHPVLGAILQLLPQRCIWRAQVKQVFSLPTREKERGWGRERERGQEVEREREVERGRSREVKRERGVKREREVKRERDRDRGRER